MYMILEEQYNAEGAKPPKQTLTGDTHHNNTQVVRRRSQHTTSTPTTLNIT